MLGKTDRRNTYIKTDLQITDIELIFDTQTLLCHPVPLYGPEGKRFLLGCHKQQIFLSL